MNLGLETGTFAPALIAALRPYLAARKIWQPRTLPRGTSIFGPDDDSGDVVLLLSGLAKLAYITADGNEWIKSFILDQGIFAPRDGDAMPYQATCVETSTIVRLPRAVLDHLAAEDASIAAAASDFSQWVLRRKQEREAAMLTLSPENRYRTLQAHAPDALGRLPQGDIARFLGITPVAFSRVKRRIKP